MAREKKNGNNPQNARINIKYSGKKPEIKFSYPIAKKDKPMRGSMFPCVFIIWFLVFVILFEVITISEDFNTTEFLYTKQGIEDFTQCAVIYDYQTIYNYSNVRYNLCNQHLSEWRVLLNGLSGLLIFFGGIIIPPIIFYWMFKKRLNKLFPAYQAFMASKKIRKFKVEDVIENDEGIYVELPIFSNVICDFKCKDDFSDYLKEIDIREHKFYYAKKRTIKYKGKKKKIKKYNEFIWYARWYFSQKPKKGYMDVIYK